MRSALWINTSVNVNKVLYANVERTDFTEQRSLFPKGSYLRWKQHCQMRVEELRIEKITSKTQVIPLSTGLPTEVRDLNM